MDIFWNQIFISFNVVIIIKDLSEFNYEYVHENFLYEKSQ